MGLSKNRRKTFLFSPLRSNARPGRAPKQTSFVAIFSAVIQATNHIILVLPFVSARNHIIGMVLEQALHLFKTHILLHSFWPKIWHS